MALLSMYDACIQKVSRFLNEGIWDARRQNNPFKQLPSKIIRDLTSSTLLLQNPNSFRPNHLEPSMTNGTLPELKIQGLELLLTSETLPELNIRGMDVERNLERALESLASSCQNLEVLTLINLEHSAAPSTSKVLEKVISNSHNLKEIHCEVEFDLKVLRNCKKLRSVKLCFCPNQPWYEFLQEEDGCLQNLDSLEIFGVIPEFSSDLTASEDTDYIISILLHCPALTSFGFLDTTRTLAQLYRTGISNNLKLRQCQWCDKETRVESVDESIVAESTLHPEVFRDAVIYHGFVEELYVRIYSIQSIPYLSNLRNLTFLDIIINIKSDYSVQICNVFKDIGVQLKYLCLWCDQPTDVSLLLQNCPNLEALRILAFHRTRRFEADIHLPNLQYLSLNVSRQTRHLLSRFSGCHNLTELSMLGLNDQILNRFLRRNSLTKLKIAYFEILKLSTRGFKKFLLNAPELQKIVSECEHDREFVKAGLRKANHNAICDQSLIREKDEYFNKMDARYIL